MRTQGFLKSKLATWVLGVILILVMIIAAKILIQKQAVDSEIAKLQSQVGKIKKDNNQLTYLVQYFNTPDYQEKAAREQLNLKKDGEYVVGLPSSTDANSVTQTNPKTSNLKQWFNYFFSKPSN